MNIICPECATHQDVRPEEVLGHIYVCENCHIAVYWKKELKEPQNKVGLKTYFRNEKKATL